MGGGGTHTSDILPLDWSIAHTSVMERPKDADESASASDAATTSRAGRDVASESSLFSFACERKFQLHAFAEGTCGGDATHLLMVIAAWSES